MTDIIIIATHANNDDTNMTAKKLKRKKIIGGTNAKVVPLLDANEASPNNGPKKMLTALKEKVKEYSQTTPPTAYSLLLEGNYGSRGLNIQKVGETAGENAWIVDKIIAIMDEYKHYPTYFVMEGNGETSDPKPKQEAIKLAQEHSKGKYHFRAAFNLTINANSPEPVPRVLALNEAESKGQNSALLDISPGSDTGTPTVTRARAASSSTAELKKTPSAPTLFGASKKDSATATSPKLTQITEEEAAPPAASSSPTAGKK